MRHKLYRLQKKQRGILEQKAKKTGGVQAASLARHIPTGAQAAMERAFCAAFATVFQKGIGVIEHTYGREEREERHRMQAALFARKPGRRSLRALEKSALRGQELAALATAAEGGILGAAGIGLPDIPLFAGVLLRGVCQIAVGYGFDHDSREERTYLLSVIRCALTEGPDVWEMDRETDLLGNSIGHTRGFAVPEEMFQTALTNTGEALSRTMLGIKFLQGIPLIGVAGGAANFSVYQKVIRWAALKYEQRCLQTGGPLCVRG